MRADDGSSDDERIDIDLVEQEEWLALGRAVHRAFRSWPTGTRLIDAMFGTPLVRAWHAASDPVGSGFVPIIGRSVPDRTDDVDAVIRSASDLAELESRLITSELVLAVSQSEDGSVFAVAAHEPSSTSASWSETFEPSPGSMDLDVAEQALAKFEAWMRARVAVETSDEPQG